MLGEESSFEFSPESVFIGYDGYSDNGKIIGLSVVTMQQ